MDELTEGQRLFVREKYGQALSQLRQELELAQRLGASGIEPEIEDPRVHQLLIASLEKDPPSPFAGQAGVLDIARELIQRQARVDVALGLLSVLEESSNEGVRFLAGLLQNIQQGPVRTWHTRGIEPYRTASTAVDDQSQFFLKFGIFLLTVDQRSFIPTGGLTETIELFESARTGFEEGTPDYAGTQMNEATARKRLAKRGENLVENLTTAIELHELARTGFEEGTSSYARTQVNEANVRTNLAKRGENPVENLTTAIELSDSARTGFEEGTPSYARTQVNEANARKALAKRGENPVENLTTAIDLYESARIIFEEATPSYASTQLNEANTRQELARRGENPVENLTTAIELHELARTGFEEDTPDYATTHMNEAIARRQLAERGENPEMHIAEAAELCRKAIQTFDRIFDYESLRKASETQAELYRSSGELEKAYESYTRAIEAIEEIRETVRQGENRAEFFDEHIELYRSTVQLALTLDNPEEAFKYVERAKGRLFLDKLADTDVKGDIPEGLAEDEKQLKAEIANLRIDLDPKKQTVGSFEGAVSAGAEAIGRGLTSSSRSSLNTPRSHTGGQQRSADAIEHAIDEIGNAGKNQQELRNELQEKTQELQEVQADIEEHDPEAYTLRSVNVASLAEIQAELRPDEQLLEYFIADEDLVIFLIDEYELRTAVVSIDESEQSKSLISVIKQYRTLIESGSNGDRSQWQALGEQLYEWLIEPVEEQLTADTLVIVPHGWVHKIPLAALYNSNQYLIEQYQLRVLANASTLRFLDTRADGELNEALVVGDPRSPSEDDEGPTPDPLPNARQEAKEVAELHDAEPLIGPDATKTDVEKGLEQADLSHLACHAEYDSKSPAHSRILLAETVLSLDELFELEIGGELVTLAACETAFGEATRGDEVQSLTRGFQYAGAASVIGTLWEVADKLTPAFFREFYTAEGSYTERLQQAQLSFIQAGDERTHPYYWSGFHLYGSP